MTAKVKQIEQDHVWPNPCPNAIAVCRGEAFDFWGMMEEVKSDITLKLYWDTAYARVSYLELEWIGITWKNNMFQHHRTSWCNGYSMTSDGIGLACKSTIIITYHFQFRWNSYSYFWQSGSCFLPYHHLVLNSTGYNFGSAKPWLNAVWHLNIRPKTKHLPLNFIIDTPIKTPNLWSWRFLFQGPSCLESIPELPGTGGLLATSEVHSYFRAIQQRNETSKRALQLTAHVIEHNSANYTAWYYRRRCLKDPDGLRRAILGGSSQDL